MTFVFRPVGLGPVERRRFLGGECELRLGVCLFPGSFAWTPGTTARFSHLDTEVEACHPLVGR